MFFDQICKSILNESSVGIRTIDSFSDAEKADILGKLSDVERNQLGSEVGGKSKRKYMSADDWIVIRDYTLRKALERNPDTNPDLCAYTPSETLKLLSHPIIKDWFKKVTTFKVPEGKKKVIFVSCAASKRWGDNTKSPDYQCYNMIRGERSDVYWVTISEPLGIVPEEFWNTFPLYDNPGLFKDRGVSTQFWLTVMKRDKSYLYPFDDAAKSKCISILGDVIKKFYEYNKSLNPDLEFISAVETGSEKSTHSEMLDVAGILPMEKRFPKKREGIAYGRDTKQGREEHWRDITNK